MFDLEQSIADWRKQMLAAGIKTPVPLEELEIHLREEIEQQMKSGTIPQQAFENSVERIGHADELKGEFKKIGGTTCCIAPIEFVLDWRPWFDNDTDFKLGHAVRVSQKRISFFLTSVVGCLASELRYVYDFHHQWPYYWLCPLEHQMDFVMDQQPWIHWHNDREFSLPVRVSPKRFGQCFSPASGSSVVGILRELDDFHHHGSCSWAFRLYAVG